MSTHELDFVKAECINMGKSGKLFKGLVAGVRALKAPSKENSNGEEKEEHRKGIKDKCLWSLGKSSSRNRDTAAPSRSPVGCDVVEIKVVQVEHQKAHVSPISKQSCPATKVPASDLKQVTAMDAVEMLKYENWAATKIQATFRCYLAYREFRTLKALVKLQALVRGRIVRRQAATTFGCMQALVRIQAVVRGRRVRLSELGQLVHKYLHQTRQQRRKPVEGWVSSMASMKELQAKAQSKQEAVMKRQRALVYAFSEQLRRPTPKQSLFVVECQLDKDSWVWIWLERWMSAHPWGNGLNAVKERPRIVSAEQMSAEDVTVAKTDFGHGKQYMDTLRQDRQDVNRFHYGEGFESRQRENSLKEEIYMEKLIEKPNKESLTGNNVGPLMTHTTPSLETHLINAMENVQPVTTLSMCEKSPPSSRHSIAMSIPAVTYCIMEKLPAAVSQSIERSTPAPTPMGENSPRSMYTPLKNSVIPEVGDFPLGGSPWVTLPSTNTGNAIMEAELGFSVALNVSSISLGSSSSPLGDPNALSSSLPSSIVNSVIMEDGLPQQHQSTTKLSICGTENHLSLRHANTIIGESNGHQEKCPAVNSTYEEKLNACWDDDMARVDTLSDMNSRCSSVVSASPVIPEVTSTRLSNSGGSKTTDGASPLIPSYMAPTQSAKAKIRAHISPKQKSDSPNSTASSGPMPRRRHSLSGLEAKSPPTTQRHFSHVRAASKGQGQLASVKDGDASLNSNAESCSSHCK